MEQHAYIISIAASIFYFVASVRLLRLSRRTGERPELYLGIYFACTGQWYAIYNAPAVFGFEVLPQLVENGMEWVYAVGVVPYLLFIRRVFRPGASWATTLLVVSSLFLLGGAAASGLDGDFANESDDPGWIAEWIGYTIPGIWLSFEGFGSHASARKRIRLGICEPIVANRYLLFASFGICQTAACAADLLWALGNRGGEIASGFATGLLSATEISSVACLWLAFFPPLFYRRWVDRRAASIAAPGEVD